MIRICDLPPHLLKDTVQFVHPVLGVVQIVGPTIRRDREPCFVTFEIDRFVVWTQSKVLYPVVLDSIRDMLTRIEYYPGST